MRAPTARNLCTLSDLFRTHKPNTKVVSFIKPSPGSQGDFSSELHHSSELDLARDYSRRTLGDSADKNVDTTELSALLCCKQDKTAGSEEVDHEEKRKRALDIPWVADLSYGNLIIKRKEVARERKHKWIFKYTSNHRFDRLIELCGAKLGTGKTVNVFAHLGRETGVKEFRALIKICIEKARATDNEYIAVSEMSKAFHLFKEMMDRGYPLGEQTYDPLLRYIIDMGLVQEFQLFSDFIKAENPGSVSRLGYYEMLLWLRVDNEEMIRDICEYITVEDGEDTSALRGW
ncbi:unnamed protein product [Sphenostylis stenocarpa]|uniref:Pentatricopeptide repeat-containing protein n=1 Tax=Sphenostylis stenocarpa TaxID=92480 RepID=A0AA87B8I7_9FABA|nr:unnamed protein product [Sphenostylis stenocarpa]